MNDEYEGYASMTVLAKFYGLTSHKLGRILKDLKLRDAKGKPVGFGKEITIRSPSTQPGTYFDIWHQTSVMAILDRLGYTRVTDDEK